MNVEATDPEAATREAAEERVGPALAAYQDQLKRAEA
jgi:hypothetical protein